MVNGFTIIHTNNVYNNNNTLVWHEKNKHAQI